MKPGLKRLFAIVEVVGVRFLFIPAVILGQRALFPQFEIWQVKTLNFPFPVFSHVLFAGIVLLLMLFHGGNMKKFGLNFSQIKTQLDIAGTCFLPVVLASIPFGLGLDYTSWKGAWILSLTKIALLMIMGWLLKEKPGEMVMGLLVLGITFSMKCQVITETLGWKAFVVFLTYALFVGFGEEIVYRGYIQSRLNQAFGKPYTFFGIPFGWGLIISAFIFGLSHVGLTTYLLDPASSLTWAWGLWTFFGGLVYGIIREKSDGILAPALLHGFPQALASAIFVFLN